jgi:hypothetical protein
MLDGPAEKGLFPDQNADHRTSPPDLSACSSLTYRIVGLTALTDPPSLFAPEPLRPDRLISLNNA